MKKNIAKVVCVSSMLLVVACGPKIKTERISLEKSDELAMTITDEWIMTDTQNAVKAILSQIEQHRGFQGYLAKLGRRPKIFIADIQKWVTSTEHSTINVRKKILLLYKPNINIRDNPIFSNCL